MGKKTQILDIVRICAALMVFTVHFFMFVEAPSFISRITANFSSGVAMFFVISGYLMMQSLDSCRSLSEYYKKRVIRIIPSYYAIVLTGLIVWDVILAKMPEDSMGLGWLRYFLFLNTIVPSKDYYSWNDLWGLWTFSCFMVFYLVAPLIKKCVKNYKSSVVALFLLIVFAYVSSYVTEHVFVNMGFEDAYIIAGDSPWFNLSIFAIGVALWYAKKEQKEINYAGICGIVILALMLIDKATNRIAFGCVMAVIIICFWNVDIKGRVFNKVVDSLSVYSFPLYLVHLAVMQLLNILRQSGVIGSNVVFAGLIIVVSAVAAVALYWLVDVPCGKIIKKLSVKK